VGNAIAKSITSGILAAKGDSKRTLKISTKGIPDYNGNQDSWTKWKTSAMKPFITGGYKEILECYVYSEDMKQTTKWSTRYQQEQPLMACSPRISYSGMEDNTPQLQFLIDYRR